MGSVRPLLVAGADHSGTSSRIGRYQGGDAGGGHFSQATQITPENVSELEIAWTHRSGDFRQGENFIGGLSGEAPLQSSWQATPVLIDDHLYLCTPFNRILAIHAETGAERWSYAPDIDLEGFPMPRCRGVTQWTDTRLPEGEPCHRVVIAPLMDARVVGLDADSGEVCPFGNAHELDLSEGLGPYETGFYMLNTPPAITGNTLITGGSVADNITTAVPSGVIRAYDLSSGKLLWAWEPVIAVTESGKAASEAGDNPANCATQCRYAALSAGHDQLLVLSVSRPGTGSRLCPDG